MKTLSIQAPGSVMIMGEHAVLHDQPALVMAVNRFVTITLSAASDEMLTIDSSYGLSVSALSDSPEAPWAQLLATVVQSFLPKMSDLKHGLKIVIDSTFEGAMGLSSSTAVTAALTYGLMSNRYPLLSDELIKEKCFTHIMQLMQSIEQPASGAALSAILFGGCRYYYPHKKLTEKLDINLPFYLLFCGYKTPTKEVIEIIKARFADNKEVLHILYETIGMAVTDARDAIEDQQWDKFYKIAGIQQFLLHDLGVSDETLDAIINQAMSLPNTKAAKISGAGLGDCVLVFGEYHQNDWDNFKELTPVLVNIEQEGVRLC